MSDSFNPFFIYGYGGSKYFCDREQETEQLISSLKNGRNITLLSPRRMGKTGLVLRVFDEIKKRDKTAACFYVDIFPTRSLENFVAFLGKAILGTLDGLGKKALNAAIAAFKSCKLSVSVDPVTGLPQSGLEFQSKDAKNTLQEIFDYLKNADRECFVAIDEFQQIAEYEDDNVEALLRSYIQFCPNVHFIFSGSKHHLMSEMFSSVEHPFYRSTEMFHLYAIDENAYYEFANGWMKKAKISLPKDVFHDLYERLEGHTWYMQAVLNRLYEIAPKKVCQDDVNMCVTKIMMSETDIYQRMQNILTSNQNALLIAIAYEGCVKTVNSGEFVRKSGLKTASSVNRALEFLLDKEYVMQTPKGYVVYDRFFALWLKGLL